MKTELDEAISALILSASGWRGVFAEDGGAESRGETLQAGHTLFAAAAAKVFSGYITARAGGKGAIVVGRDTRPTGRAAADAVIRALVSEGREVRYAGICAAPEIMAFTKAGAFSGEKEESAAAGFIYLSASHNPIGHNGVKFGLADGGVLPAEENAKLVAALRALADSPGGAENISALLARADTETLAGVYGNEGLYKKAALALYRDFSAEVISGTKDKTKSEELFGVIRGGLAEKPLGIAADLNGSARTVSIDREFLSSLGVRYRAMNDTPGRIAHRIVPEGESLEPCRLFVEELHREDPSFVMGYVPDCDGDRGNIVFWDDSLARARILEAQEVFALACVSELALLTRNGELVFDAEGKPLVRAAISVNDPTSLRVDRVARCFGVEVFRSETGEANTVGLARRLREEGCIVRILGEGSSGGTIIHPSSVRDPIDTLGAILKLLAVRSGGGRKGFFEIWCERSNQKQKYREDFTLADIIATLPHFVSTGLYTKDALLNVAAKDHGALKDEYQKIFLRDWEKEQKEELNFWGGITEWEAIAYNGMEEKRGVTRFGEAGRGGLKIVFTGEDAEGRKEEKACVWMRGSGTEPVFRVMADADGPALEMMLIEWQRRMVLEADSRLTGK